jgi:hypothetical protein
MENIKDTIALFCLSETPKLEINDASTDLSVMLQYIFCHLKKVCFLVTTWTSSLTQVDVLTSSPGLGASTTSGGVSTDGMTLSQRTVGFRFASEVGCPLSAPISWLGLGFSMLAQVGRPGATG